MGNAKRGRARAPVLDYSEPSRAERSRRDGESWLLFEGIDTFLYGLMRKSKSKSEKKSSFVSLQARGRCDAFLFNSKV